MTKSIYVINPRHDFPGFYTLDALGAGGPRLQPFGDLAITTVAALAPPDFDVRLCDEVVADADMATDADFVAITGKAGQIYRMLALGDEYRSRGKVVVMGGPFASLSPESVRPFCDVLVIGELESVAGDLFSDLRAGRWREQYVGDKPDLATTPVPRWELYPNERTLCATVQTSRGCPFECDFCDVIEYLGRRQRHKPVANVLRELDKVYGLGYRDVFLADDNLTVHRSRAKELAAAIAAWNSRRTDRRVEFSTQVSIDAARDEELLGLWARAGLTSAFVGVETPNAESLREAKKRQNLRVDLVEQVGRFLAHGVGVVAGMIVGFDSDGPDIFERQYAFAMASPVPIFALNALVAPPGTPLFHRLAGADRLRTDSGTGFMLGRTNFVPLRMSLAELETGFKWLCNTLYEPAAFQHRMLRFVDEVAPVAGEPATSFSLSGLDLRVLGQIRRLGDREASMVTAVCARLEAKPAAAAVGLGWLRMYAQIRHMYAQGRFWDPQLATASAPPRSSAGVAARSLPIVST